MNLEALASDLLDSRRFCDLLKAASGVNKRSLEQKDRIALLLPLIGMVQLKLIDGNAGTDAIDNAARISTRPKTKEGPSQAPIHDKAQPQFELGDMGDVGKLPFDPFEHPKEPDHGAVIQEHAAMLATALEALPVAGIGTRATFSMPMDWNAGEALKYFAALAVEGSPWGLVENGVRLGSEKVSDGPRAQAWSVTVVRVK